ncbi:hypothetical protein [Pantanalinema sp. GBBB05]|uniref:hypothetical protein n=1 Tax=Pantanalinema sp. GBBB05 TaxID=2604139 RepID=UPI001D850212|nr:hypothetical protein [Pantanalinema sp. GBBB05]
MSSANLSLEFVLKQLRELRSLLLPLHKALLESERVSYEESHGRIQSKGEYFQLVVSHEWFSWLRPISQYIVQIDEFLAAKEPVTLSEATALFAEARQLLQPSEEGTHSEQRYHQAIQRDPDVAFMHAKILRLLMAKN